MGPITGINRLSMSCVECFDLSVNIRHLLKVMSLIIGYRCVHYYMASSCAHVNSVVFTV
jgi:hypothetical protein